MIVNLAEGWATVTPPKTASTTLHELLCRPEWGGRRHDANPDRVPNGWQQHHTEIPPTIDQIIFTCRNPYTRSESLFWHKLHDLRYHAATDLGWEPHHLDLPALHDPAKDDEFGYRAMFVRYMRRLTADKAYTSFFASCSWYLDRVDRNLKIHLVHTETLAEDLAKLPFGPREVDGDTLPLHNRQRHNRPRLMWTKCPELVNQWAARDFELFDYKMETEDVAPP